MRLLELFKGTGSVGKVAKKLGFEIVSMDIDPFAKADIQDDILKWNYEKFYESTGFVPDFIWASPPCNTFSPLAFPLKERDPKTAVPKSDRAKLGTKILYKTLQIIVFFHRLNPDLKFVIENPKGMMRNDKQMKKIPRYTTLYCLYGDKRRKETDFWSNFPLNLKEDRKCPGETIGVVDVPLCERYKIPAKLIQQIFKDYFEILM